MTPGTVLSLWKGEIAAGPTMAGIAMAVAARHGLTVVELKSTCRRREIVWPRQEAIYEMVQAGRWSTPRIGMFFDGLDHTTILHSHDAHRRRLLGQPSRWREGATKSSLTIRLGECGDKTSRRMSSSSEAA